MNFKARAWINLLGVLLFLIPGCVMVITTSIHFVQKAWLAMEGSPDPGGIPFRFIVKGFIPVGFLLLLLQGISLGLHSLLRILGLEAQQEGRD
jgi:TRAP-type mannitol/chloroaromatic compound transport system permease small subunit